MNIDGLPNGTEDLDARYIIKRYDEIIEDISETNNTYIDYLVYDTLNVDKEDKEFRLLYKPAPGSIRFFINGVQYLENTGAFEYNEENNSIQWRWTPANFGFSLKPSYNYMAIYDYYVSDNLSYANIEQAVNGLILINPELLRTDFDYDTEKEKQLVNYISRQISKGNLSYKAITNLYPDLAKDISKSLLTISGQNNYLTDALNVLLLINPKLLYKDDLPEEFDKEMIIEYINYQIDSGAIDEDEFYSRYPHMYKLLKTNKTNLDTIIEENELDKKYPKLFNRPQFYTYKTEDKD